MVEECLRGERLSVCDERVSVMKKFLCRGICGVSVWWNMLNVCVVEYLECVWWNIWNVCVVEVSVSLQDE